MIYQDSSINWSEDINDWKKYIDKEYVDSSISNLKDDIDSSISLLDYKISDIQKNIIADESEKIILATDDNVEITSISVEKTIDESEILEFKSNNESDVYAKIGSIDNKKGLFVNELYDLNGNPLLTFDSSNDILILGGKKYKMIPFIEET